MTSRFRGHDSDSGGPARGPRQPRFGGQGCEAAQEGFPIQGRLTPTYPAAQFFPKKFQGRAVALVLLGGASDAQIVREVPHVSDVLRRGCHGRASFPGVKEAFEKRTAALG